MEDIERESSNTIMRLSDMFPIPLYQPLYQNLPDPVADVINWVIESQIPRVSLDLVKKIETNFIKYFATHPLETNRPIVSMGYSGGFMPLVEAVSQMGYNVKTIVGLGAASAYLSSDILSIINDLLQYVTNKSLDMVKTALEKLYFGVPFIDDFLEKMADFIDSSQADYYTNIMPMVKEVIRTKASEGWGTNWVFPSLAGTNTDMIVNVWGTKDVLYEVGMAGKRENFCGIQQTYNIEIVGATHFDYMRRASSDEWNSTVANFVADLLINSDNETRLKSFLERSDSYAYLDLSRNVWQVKLPGYETHQ